MDSIKQHFNKFNKINLNLGLPTLLPQWKKFFSHQYLMSDMVSGLTVAFIAIPLSLAIALASGVSPGIGLISAIIAGIVCGLFGGTPLAVSGPAAAMSVLIADIVHKFGFESLILIGLVAGLMQLMSGIIGLGRIMHYIPIPVIAGFTAGIGVIILINQMPHALGIAHSSATFQFTSLTGVKYFFQSINLNCVFLTLLTIVMIKGLPKVFPKVPAILPAVVVTSLIAYFAFKNVPLIGTIPDSLPSPSLPALGNISLYDLVLTSFIVYLIASLETLLSSSAVDKIAKGEKHNADQELIGQGLGNMTVAFFSGIPITGVIARSLANVYAGAKTRRSSLIHSGTILIAIFFAAQLISKIPIAVLAGVLFSIAFSMINYREFFILCKKARTEATIYGITFLTIVFFNLLAGVQVGIITACIIILIRATKTHLHVTANSRDEIVRLSLVGALTFLSTPKIINLQKQLNRNINKTVILDLSSIRNLDLSGASAVTDLFHYCRLNNMNFFLKGLPKRFESLFRLCGGANILEEWCLVSEHELRKKSISGASVPQSAYGRLVHGFELFHIQRRHDDRRLYEAIRKKQDPHTIFIACSDSRVIPSQMTSADPGELFIVRNVGNYIPLYHPDYLYSEAVAIEFALSHFDITDIVVCGHANCGAMKACLKNPVFSEKEASVAAWVSKIKTDLDTSSPIVLNELARMNVINQVRHLQSYPIVQEKMAQNNLKVHGWFYNFEKNLIYEWEGEDHGSEFTSIIKKLVPDLVK